jgi:outer membrane lipoprotein SlyB
VGAFPRLPFNTGDLTTGGIVAGVAAVVAALVGAILGGLAGMRFHRKVDQAGLGH